MATILRSSKYIRCLNAIARRTVIAQEVNEFATKSLILRAQCANSYFMKKSYATIPAIQRNESVVNFDRSFAKLDENVQRYGRVFKPEIEAILDRVRDTGCMASLDALLLIRCCGDLLVDTVPQERNQLLDEIWTTLDTLKIPVDASHFNALLRVYLDNGKEFSPIEFLTTMRDKRAEPNRITYQRLMLYYCKRGDMEGATKILEFMREKGIPLNEGVFNALIIGHSEANDMNSAKNVMNVMREAGVEPCGSTYTALLTAYAKRGDMASIKETLNEFSTKNLYLQDSDYFEVINVLAANGHVDLIDEILPLMAKGSNYNIDATHAILKILDVGSIDAALKILPTMKSRRRTDEDAMENENGVFLIRKMVNSKYSPEEIVKACETLQKRGENTRAFFSAVERSLANGDVDLSIPLLKAWQKNGGEIREHYFWPILAAFGRASNYQGIVKVASAMVTDFEVKPTVETIKEYILPYTVGKWDDVVPSLRECQIAHEDIVTAIAMRMLTDHKPRKTAIFMMSYPTSYKAEYFYRPLAETLRVNADAKSFAFILRLLCDTAFSAKSENPNENLDSSANLSIVDKAMLFALDYIPPNKYAIIDKVLEHMVEYGLTLSPQMGSDIRSYFGDQMNPTTDERIEKLTSGNLQLTPITQLEPFANISETGQDFEGSDLRGGSRFIFGTKRRELAMALQNEDVEAVEKILKDLESLVFTFSPALSAQIIEFYCATDNMEQAEKWMNKTKSEIPGVTLDAQKMTEYAAMLIKNNRFDDALECIKNSPRKATAENHGPSQRKVARALLDLAAETGNVEKTNQLLDALVESNYIAIDNYILGPLIKVHLIRNDLQGALAAFESSCQNHHCTPMKNELSKKFIDTEDANSLQRLTDLSTDIHGESNSLVDLVLAFVECGRLRQARKILETPGLRLRGKKLKATVERYVDDDETDCLEQFTDITKGLPVIDRQELYEVILDAYNKKNNWQRGLTLWTMMQDEDVQPSDSFLRILAELLVRNNQPVPFVYNNIGHATPSISRSDQETRQNIKEIYNAIEAKNLERAERLIRSVGPESEEFNFAMCKLIEVYAKDAKNLDKSSMLIEELIVKHGKMPRAHTMKILWNGFMDAEEFDKLRRHGNILSSGTKKKLRFNKYLTRAVIREKGLTKFLDDFYTKISSSRVENFQLVRDGLHFSTVVKLFVDNPDAVDKFEAVAEKFAEQEIYSPINIVWSYYFENQKPEAEAVWSKHLAKSDRVMFKYLIDTSSKDNNVQLMERVYDKICTNTGLSDSAKLYAFSALINLYNKNGRIDDALKVVERESPETMKLWTKINPIIFHDFKQSVESSGKTVPFKVDEKKLDQQ